MKTTKAQNNKSKTQPLSAQEQSLVAISALTSVGNLEALKTQLNTGLESGLTVNEIRDAMEQLYAYAGFPRSLNALTLFMDVVDQRKKASKKDVQGREASPLPADTTLLEKGTSVQTQLVGKHVSGGVMDFSPAIDRYLKEHLFGAIFSSDILTFQQRELVTVAALASMEGVEAQLQSHMSFAMNIGVTQSQLSGIFEVIEKSIGKRQADKGKAALLKVVPDNRDK